MTTIARCGWFRFIECGELLYGRIFPQNMKGAVYRSMCGSEAWCLKESEVEILRRTERTMVRAMCGVQLKDKKRSIDLMFMLGLNETIDQLARANSVCWYCHVLERGWSCFEKGIKF